MGGHVGWCGLCAQKELAKSVGCCMVCGSTLSSLRIDGKVVTLCDLRDSLNSQGFPSRCFSCLEYAADVLVLPCQHLRLCSLCVANCAPKGCPTCGTEIKHKCVIKWPKRVHTACDSMCWKPHVVELTQTCAFQ